jgi:hypothetical protein
MTGGRPAGRGRTRAPLGQRNRRRWAVAGAVAACWVVLEVVTSSAVSATVVLMVMAALAVAGLAGLRILGVTRDHPWIRRMASRPWRDGQDVLKVAMRHLADVFVITPSGELLAPNVVELQLNPDDLDSLCERMELGVVSASMTEVYQEQVTAYGARLAGAGGAEVYVSAAGSVPPGRYRLRHPDPVGIDAHPDHGRESCAKGAGMGLLSLAARPRRAGQPGLGKTWPGPDGRRGDGHDHGTRPCVGPGAAAGHRLLGSGNPDVRGPGRARVRRADAP